MIPSLRNISGSGLPLFRIRLLRIFGRFDALASQQNAGNVSQSCARARLPDPHGDSGVHLRLPDDGPARLRHAHPRLRCRRALRRAEIAQALHLVLPRRRRVPRGGDQQDPRRPGARHPAALHAARSQVQRARRYPHHGDRRASQRGLAGHPEQPGVNPLLEKLQPYPFEKLRRLLAGVAPNESLKPINLQIGEPKHPTPELVKRSLVQALDGLAIYPLTAGLPELRQAISQWLERRYGIPAPDPATQVLPVNGTREALFAFAQTILSPGESAKVVCPNPFYQIYEGAALLGGATPVYGEPRNWDGVQLVYACSPANPSGAVMSLEDWKRLFELSDRHGFVIASDECYSEIYFDRPPLGALEAAHKLGRTSYERLMVFSSLSKRSNCPGMRSGFAAGDAALLKKFLLYRTYHGSAMSLAVQQASIAAWGDEKHVTENRRLYAEKFDAVVPMLKAEKPDGGFYLWLKTPGDDADYARRLHHEYNVLVLPGSFLARDAAGGNPGRNHIRVALVASTAECVEAAQRLQRFAQNG